MLILTRKIEESIVIGNGIEIKIVDVRGDNVKIGISAPKDVSVHRKEIYDAIKQANADASKVKGVKKIEDGKKDIRIV